LRRPLNAADAGAGDVTSSTGGAAPWAKAAVTETPPMRTAVAASRRHAEFVLQMHVRFPLKEFSFSRFRDDDCDILCMKFQMDWPVLSINERQLSSAEILQCLELASGMADSHMRRVLADVS